MRRIYLNIIFLNLFILNYSNSFSSNDSIPVIFSWQLTKNFSEIEYLEIDTSLTNFQHYDIIKRKSISNTFLGNPGQASISNIYLLRRESPIVFFNPYNVYLFNNNNAKFYNTRKHYTSLNYISNGSKTIGENWINIIHTQNINPYLNVGFNYRLISSKGQYQSQSTRNNSVSLFASYNKFRYSIHGLYSYNKFRINDNGGIKNDIFVEDKDTLTDPAIFTTNLNNAKSTFINTNILFVNKYKIGRTLLKQINDSTKIKYIKEKANIIYYIDIQNYRKLYFDDSTGFYQNYFISNEGTYDSTQYNIISNALQFKLNPDSNNIIPFGISTTIKSYLTNYHCYDIDTSLIDNSIILNIDNADLSAIKYNFSTEYFFNGYRQNDFNATLNLLKSYNNDSSLFLFDVDFSKKKPDISETLYASNNYVWDTTYLSKDKTNIRLMFINKKFRIQLIANYSILDNFIYFNENTLPVQNTSTFNILTLGLVKNIKFKRFNFNNTFYYQKSDNNNVIRLPDICYNNTTFFEFSLLKGVINSQIGFDVYYNSAFYGYSYSPALSTFYIQNDKKIGNYPYVDLFINFKLKRARIFIKYEHTNHNLIDRKYFLAYHYPAQEKMMKFGISWNFYD